MFINTQLIFQISLQTQSSSPVLFYSLFCSVFWFLDLLTMAKNLAQAFLERKNLASHDPKVAMAKRCAREGVIAGAKAAAIASIATAIPTCKTKYQTCWDLGTMRCPFTPCGGVELAAVSHHFASVRMLPWAKAHLNHTAQALIISTVAGAAYFIVADKTVLATARRNSFKQKPNTEAYEFN
uniref:Early nodulin-93-like n=1 Tax=Cucumis melo TaxID=3656 RepID=A0A9I9CJG7_CUCME